jgi:hypothetical protein
VAEVLDVSLKGYCSCKQDLCPTKAACWAKKRLLEEVRSVKVLLLTVVQQWFY